MHPDLNIAIIQTDLHWENTSANLAMLSTKINTIATPRDLIVLPEMFSTGYSMNVIALAQPMDGEAMQWLAATASSKSCTIVGSLMLYTIVNGSKHYHNRLIWMPPSGQYLYYDKRHLFSLADEHLLYTTGAERLIVSLQGWRICPMICYDLRFPEWSRNKITADGHPTYDMLLYVASWPSRRSHAWRSLLPARAIENQCYALGVNRVGLDGDGIAHDGYSMALDPLGELLYEPNGMETTSMVTLSHELLVKTRRLFPFLKDGDGQFG